MAELRKCSRRKSLITLEHYSFNRHGNYFKCCDKCRTSGAEYRREHLKTWDCEIKCDHFGQRTTKNCKSIHERRFWCQTFGMNPRPDFEEWLKEQDYDKLLWEYKKVLEDILQREELEEQEFKACVIESDDDAEVREQKSKLAIQLLGPFNMYSDNNAQHRSQNTSFKKS